MQKGRTNFITDCSYNGNAVSISFSDTYASKRYIERMMIKFGISDLKPIKVTVLLKWFNTKTVFKRESIKVLLDARNMGSILTIKGLPDVRQAKNIGITVYFDDKLMCYVIQSLESPEIWK